MDKPDKASSNRSTKERGLPRRVSRRGFLGSLAMSVGGATLASMSPRPAAASPVAPTGASPQPPAATTQGEWVVGLAEDIKVLDPFLSLSSLAGSMVQYHIYDTLTAQIALRYAPGFALVPRLAESWKLIDSQTWELRLRRGVKWHNGDDLSAEDVKYSVDTAVATPWRPTRTTLAGAEVVGPSAIRIRTRGPQAGFFFTLSGLAVVPKRAHEQMGPERFDANPIGTGPYRFGEWVRGERVVLRANPAFWKGPVVGPSRLVLRSIPDATTRVAELRAGGAHIVAAPPHGQLEQIRQAKDLELVTLKGARAIHYRFNTMKKPFDDVRVRRAVNYAVNKDAIIKNVLGGLGEPLHGPFGSAWSGYDATLQPYPYDPAKAKQLLTEAGYGAGFEVPFYIGSGGNVLNGQDIAEVVAGQLAEVGIRLRIVPAQEAKIDDAADNGALDGILQTTWGTAADPDGMLTVTLYKTKLIAPDPQLAALIEQSKATLDPEKRKAVFRQIGRYVHDQALWLFIHAQDDFWAKRKTVAWQPYPISGTFSRVLFYKPN